jgi:hypothetical protein
MPEINNTHKLERLKDRLAQIKRDEEVDIRDINNLLDKNQQQRLKDLWTDEQTKRKDKSYKKQTWQSKKDVRIKVISEAIDKLSKSALDDFKQLVQKREQHGAKVFMEAWSEALKEGKGKFSAISAGNIAMTRAGFKLSKSIGNNRDKEVADMEAQLLKQFESELDEDEKEQRKLLKEHEKTIISKKK